MNSSVYPIPSLNQKLYLLAPLVKTKHGFRTFVTQKACYSQGFSVSPLYYIFSAFSASCIVPLVVEYTARTFSFFPQICSPSKGRKLCGANDSGAEWIKPPRSEVSRWNSRKKLRSLVAHTWVWIKSREVLLLPAIFSTRGRGFCTPGWKGHLFPLVQNLDKSFNGRLEKKTVWTFY